MSKINSKAIVDKTAAELLKPEDVDIKVTMGADPEAFALHTDRWVKDSVIPPIAFIEDKGLEYEDNGNHPIFLRMGKSYLHADGAAFEISVPPSQDWKVLWNMCSEISEEFSNTVLSQHLDMCDGKLHGIPAALWDVERWIGRGETFSYATRFGCDKDYDAWQNTAPSLSADVMDASTHALRYAGGHLHWSGLDEIEQRPLDAISALAMTAGLAATAFSPVPDLERSRVFRYGRPTKYRIQKYGDGTVGVEYRTPSASWLESSELMSHIVAWGRFGLKHLLLGGLLETLEPLKESVADAITKVEQDNALNLLNTIYGAV